MKKETNYLLALFTVLVTYSCTSPVAKEEEYNNNPKENYEVPSFIIDAHIHYRPTDEWEQSFLKVFSEYNAMGCVMVRTADFERGINFAKANTDRVIPYAMVDIDSPTILEDIKKVHAMGYRGLGELFAKNQWDYDDPKYDPIWALAQELKLPIAPHTGNLGSGEMAGLRPSFLATIAVKFPDLYIVGGHFGNPWYDEAGEAARRNKNLYFDISGSSLIKKENNPGIWKEYLWWTPYVGKTTAHMPKDLVPAFEKLVFSTDEGPDAFKENIRRFNRLLDANNVSKDSREKIYGLTMARIHGITPPTVTK